MRKREIFKAIIKIISEKGTSHLSTTEIAKKVGISQPAIYKHFKNKNELLLYFIEELKKELEKIINFAQKGETFFQKIENLYKAHFEFVETTKVIPRIVFSDEIHDDKNPEKREKFKNECFDYYRDEIKKIFLEKKISEEKSMLYAQILIGTFISTTLKWMLENSNYSLKREIPSLMNFWKSFLNEAS